MAIIKGAISFGSNFNIGAKGPIDARMRVEHVADLTTVWTTDIPAYVGMMVAVMDSGSIYVLTKDDATVEANWKEIGSNPEIVLKAENYSAAKELATANNIGQIVSVANEEAISGVTYTAGLYVVTGASEVAKLGTTSASGDLAGDVTKLKGDVSTIKETVDNLNGDSGVTGSVKNQIEAAKTELSGEINKAKAAHTEVVAKADGHVTVAVETDESTGKQTVTVGESDIASAKTLEELSETVNNISIPEYKVVETEGGFKLVKNNEDIPDSESILFKDFMVTSGEVVKGNLVDGQFTQSEDGNTYLHLVLNVEGGKENGKDLYIEATSLVDTYSVAEGSTGYISIDGYKIGLTTEFVEKIDKIDTLETSIEKVKTDSKSTNGLTVSEDIKVNKEDEQPVVSSGTTVNDVIKSIYAKIAESEAKQVSVKAGTGVEVSGEGVEKTVSVKLEKASTETVNAGHLEIVAGENGLYAQMYYMSDESSTN